MSWASSISGEGGGLSELPDPEEGVTRGLVKGLRSDMWKVGVIRYCERRLS